eukprot:12921490-Prorocentrum_lima.AAC.1
MVLLSVPAIAPQPSGLASGKTSSMWQGGCDGAASLENHMCTGAPGILLRPPCDRVEYNTPGPPLDFP